jgi:hypothetical protein
VSFAGLVPPGQDAAADGDSTGQPAGRDPGEAGFGDGPNPGGLFAAPSLTWFGAGLGPAGLWLTAWP